MTHCLIAFHPWCTDVQRVKLMNQLLVGIRVLKMYAWEVSTAAALPFRGLEIDHTAPGWC